MRAITVCVNFSDILAITARYNTHHFEELVVVTYPGDLATIELCHMLIDEGYPVHFFLTDSFYADGAKFNKFRALEEGLDAMERDGWLCIMDCDVLWPRNVCLDDGTSSCVHKAAKLKNMGLMPNVPPGRGFNGFPLDIGYLYTPLRRMWEEWPSRCVSAQSEEIMGIPPEPYWCNFPLHPQQYEWAGFSQIFHAEDPVLGPTPWHDINYSHAGTADSFFQAKWSRENKIRPSFEVLHLGKAGVNWMGRTTPYINGKVDPEASTRLQQMKAMYQERQERSRKGLDKFGHERIVVK